MRERESHKRKTWYLRQRKHETRVSVCLGIVLTLAAHAGIYAALDFSGFHYKYPPPQEQSMLLDFTEVEQPKKPVEIRKKATPTAVNPDKTKPTKLVKASKAQNVGTKENLAKESTVGDKGDVETPEPPREKPINKKSLFHNADNKTDKDTLAAQTAKEISSQLEAGHSQGNIKNGETAGVPNAELKGRQTLPGIPSPKYTGQEDGCVVVDIWVDRGGNVVKAEIGGSNMSESRYTDTASKVLHDAALKAAQQTKFVPKEDAPQMQKGTITYIFEIKAK